ncbi:DUF2493 domain-containing protein [Siminovitchia sp. 179-K 8D1 HS]|uniref:DUF2493 domain-containing protein n=1 Tax=Siminovitchia sp. 179-K 8D1 HS TaxID=3142385 RepID=UPI00399EEEF5
MYKVIVAGSRDFDDYPLLERELIHFLFGRHPNEVEIISGTARGADQLGERFAKEKGCALKLFPADWNKNGKAAGPIRNKEMSEYADACVVFWDGVSRGTKNMIDNAKRKGLKLKIVRY